MAIGELNWVWGDNLLRLYYAPLKQFKEWSIPYDRSGNIPLCAKKTELRFFFNRYSQISAAACLLNNANMLWKPLRCSKHHLKRYGAVLSIPCRESSALPSYLPLFSITTLSQKGSLCLYDSLQRDKVSCANHSSLENVFYHNHHNWTRCSF